MSWMSRAAWMVVILALPITAFGQAGDSGTDDQQPAPGEPGTGADTSDGVERYERDVSPIVGTEPSEDADETPDVAATPDATEMAGQIRQLRLDFETRLKALESRLDEQIQRIDALSSMTVTAKKPVGEAGDEEDAAAREVEQTAREAQVTQLKSELKEFREEVTRQLNALSAARSGGTTVDAAKVPDPATSSHRLRIHNTSGVEQPLYVNGVQWTVRADEWSSVPIPRGPVTVHRPGMGPLEVPADEIDWQSDQRGFFVNYDFDSHQVERPASE